MAFVADYVQRLDNWQNEAMNVDGEVSNLIGKSLPPSMLVTVIGVRTIPTPLSTKIAKTSAVGT